MNTTVPIFLLVAFVSATLAPSCSAEPLGPATNVVNRTDVSALVSGSFSAQSATVVKGTGILDTYMKSAVGIAATIKIPAIVATNAQAFKSTYQTYAFGNAEILKLALHTNVITGWALVYTNPWQADAYPLNGGAYTALKSGYAPIPGANDFFKVTVNFGDSVYTKDWLKTNTYATRAIYDESAALNVTLGSYGAMQTGFSGRGVFNVKTKGKLNPQTFGSVTPAMYIYTGYGSGSFSGVTRHANIPVP